MEIEFQEIPDALRFASVAIAKTPFVTRSEAPLGAVPEATIGTLTEPKPTSLVLPLALGASVVICVIILYYQHLQTEKLYEDE